MIVVLDNIRSCHNVGSIFRTASCAGVNKIYLCGYTPGPLNKYGFEDNRLTKVSLGAEKNVKWEHCDNTINAVKSLKDRGYKIVAVEQSEKSTFIQDFEKKVNLKNCAFVFGNEKEGVDPEVLNIADYVVEIPMFGEKKSLNVSIAVAICLFVLRLRN